MINYSMIREMWHAFTKMAVSRLIMVRFEKFKIWHAQHFNPDLPDVIDVTRDVTRARWRHARDDIIMATIAFRGSLWSLVVKQLAMYISQEPRGRFCSFFVGKSIWPGRLHMPKSSSIGQMGELWENIPFSVYIIRFPWKPMSQAGFRARPLPPCQIWCP